MLLTRSLTTRSLPHSLTHSLTHSRTYSLTHLPTYLPTYVLAHSERGLQAAGRAVPRLRPPGPNLLVGPGPPCLARVDARRRGRRGQRGWWPRRARRRRGASAGTLPAAAAADSAGGGRTGAPRGARAVHPTQPPPAPCRPLPHRVAPSDPHQVVDKMELVARTSELARVFGIDFFSVPCYTPLAPSLLHPLSTLPEHTRSIHPLITLPDALSSRAAPPHRVPHSLAGAQPRLAVSRRVHALTPGTHTGRDHAVTRQGARPAAAGPRGAAVHPRARVSLLHLARGCARLPFALPVGKRSALYASAPLSMLHSTCDARSARRHSHSSRR